MNHDYCRDSRARGSFHQLVRGQGMLHPWPYHRLDIPEPGTVVGRAEQGSVIVPKPYPLWILQKRLNQ